MAKKDKRESQRRERREFLERRKLEKKRQLEDVRDALTEDEGALAELTAEGGMDAEAIEKMGDYDAVAYVPPLGPTSFDELEAMREAEEKAHHVQMLSWDTQDLVRNIIGNPLMKPKEKAQAIKAVGIGFEERVTDMMGDGMEKSLDELELAALIAYDKRHTSVVENITDWISKKKLTSAAREGLSDEDFALVVERDGKKERKYPIQDKAHVRNALARTAQQMAAGGEAAADARKAMPKIKAAAKKFGIEMTMDKEKNAVIVEKDAKGDWRWVGWATNKWIDFDGDIIAESAHKEYLEWLDKNRDMAPAHLMWHTPGTMRENPVDFWMYENGFVILSGKLTEKEAEVALKARTLADMGMSIGALVLERDAKDPRVILKYRIYEVSDLPLENAANPWTDLDTIVKEVDMDKMEYFKTLLGEQKAVEYVKRTELKKEALETAEIESKEKDSQTAAPAKAEGDAKQDAGAPATPSPALLDMKAVVEAVIKETGMEQLSEQFAKLIEAADKVTLLEELVKDLQRDSDEQLAEKIAPPAHRFAWLTEKAASKSAENQLDEKKPADKVLKEKVAASVHWLSEATGTQPVAAN